MAARNAANLAQSPRRCHGGSSSLTSARTERTIVPLTVVSMYELCHGPLIVPSWNSLISTCRTVVAAPNRPLCRENESPPSAFLTQTSTVVTAVRPSSHPPPLDPPGGHRTPGRPAAR